ncbi:sugar phosphate isomerase/epimerase family protein [Tellurirhabdus rosea]|uniref:sugar phosphate isomerase/epimerase family protein n=1 Tax=Tellurirhabdus rosea TaxID=2674997 RepID=UPI002258EF9E|nr:sugar phosphate isomerase/epimerase [Tellurirhabdus rosea]
MSSRRDFLKNAGLLTVGAVVLNPTDLFAGKIKQFGVQLYSVRDVLPSNPKGIMEQLAKMGYQKFESYSGPQGFLWGMQPKEMRSFLNGIGVEMVSTHFDYGTSAKKPDELKKNIEMAAGAGLDYMLCPYIGAQKSMEQWKRIADDFNRVGEEVRKGGLKFGYHNHDYSFKPLDGKIPHEYLLNNTDPQNVMFELDLCWIEAAGQSAVTHLKNYGKRYELCHIKDFNRQGEGIRQADLGKGVVDYSKILKAARKAGMKHFLVEQEEYPKSPMESMQIDADYMKKLKV